MVDPCRAIIRGTPHASVVSDDQPITRPGQRLLIRMNKPPPDGNIVVPTQSSPEPAVKTPQSSLGEIELVGIGFIYEQIVIVKKLIAGSWRAGKLSPDRIPGEGIIGSPDAKQTAGGSIFNADIENIWVRRGQRQLDTAYPELRRIPGAGDGNPRVAPVSRSI